MKALQTQKNTSTKTKKLTNITLNIHPHHTINQSTGKILPKSSKYASTSKSPQRLQEIKPILTLNLSQYQPNITNNNNQYQVSSTRNNPNQNMLIQQQQLQNNYNSNQGFYKQQNQKQNQINNKNSFQTIQPNNSNNLISVNTGINNFQHHQPTSLTTTHAQYIKNQKTLNNNYNKNNFSVLKQAPMTPTNQTYQSLQHSNVQQQQVQGNHSNQSINNSHIQNNLAQVQAIVQKNLSLPLNQQILNQQQYLLQQQQLVAQQLQQSGRFNNTYNATTTNSNQDRKIYSQSQLAMNNTLPLNLRINNNHSVLEVNNQQQQQQQQNYFTNQNIHHAVINIEQKQQKRYESVGATTTNSHNNKRMNQTLCIPAIQPLNTNNVNNIENPYQNQSTIRKTDMKLNHTKDSVDRDSSQNNSVNKLRLWSSIDNQSSHSFGRKENKRYKDDDEEFNNQNELMEIQEENSFMLTKDNNFSNPHINNHNFNHTTKNPNNRTKNYELDNHFEDIQPIIQKKQLNMTLQQQKQQQHHNDFNDFLSQTDLDHNQFKIPKFGRKDTTKRIKKEQQLKDEANRFSLNPNYNNNAGRETSQGITNQDKMNHDNNINLVNMAQRPQTNMLAMQANRNLQSQLSVHNTMNQQAKKKNKTSMFSMRLRPESEISSTHNQNTQNNEHQSSIHQRNLQLDEHSLSRYNNDRDILSQTYTPVPQSVKNLNLNNTNLYYQKPFGLSFINPQTTKNSQQQSLLIDTRNNNNSSLMKFTEAQERSKSRQKAMAQQQQQLLQQQQQQNQHNTVMSNMKFYSICEEPMSNEKAFSSNSKFGSRSRERVKKDLNEQINQIQKEIQNKQVNNNYYKQINNHTHNPKTVSKASTTIRPSTSLNKSNNIPSKTKPTINFQQLDRKAKVKPQLTINNGGHNKVHSTVIQRNNHGGHTSKGNQMFKQFTNSSFLTNSNFDNKTSGRPSTSGLVNNSNQQSNHQNNIKLQQQQIVVQNKSNINNNNANIAASRPHTSMIDNQICLGLAYIVSSKLFMRIQLERQLYLKTGFDKVKQEAKINQELMEHIHGHGNKPHQNIKHCKDHSRNLSLIKPNQKSSFMQYDTNERSGDSNNGYDDSNNMIDIQKMHTQQPRVDTYFHGSSENTNKNKQLNKFTSSTLRKDDNEVTSQQQKAMQMLFHPSSEDNTIIVEEEDDEEFIRQSYDFEGDDANADQALVVSAKFKKVIKNQTILNRKKKGIKHRKVSNSQQHTINDVAGGNKDDQTNNNHNSDNYYEINLDNSDAAAYMSQDNKLNKSRITNNQQSANMQSNPIVVEYNTSSQRSDSLHNNNNNSTRQQNIAVAHNYHNSEHFNMYNSSLVENQQTQRALLALNKLNSVTDNFRVHTTDSDSLNDYNSSGNKKKKVVNQRYDNKQSQQQVKQNTLKVNSKKNINAIQEQKKRLEIQNQLNTILNDLGMVNQSNAAGSHFGGIPGGINHSGTQDSNNGGGTGNVRSVTTTSTMALIQKLQGDTDLKKKLDKVISILSAIKNDFN